MFSSCSKQTAKHIGATQAVSTHYSPFKKAGGGTGTKRRGWRIRLRDFYQNSSERNTVNENNVKKLIVPNCTEA